MSETAFVSDSSINCVLLFDLLVWVEVVNLMRKILEGMRKEVYVHFSVRLKTFEMRTRLTVSEQNIFINDEPKKET